MCISFNLENYLRIFIELINRMYIFLKTASKLSGLINLLKGFVNLDNENASHVPGVAILIKGTQQ